MAVGWARDGAVQEQIDASVADAVKQARDRLGRGESRTHCDVCEEKIPEARRKALPGVRLCVHCQSEMEKNDSGVRLFNRRGSKDSQLK
ncbi:MULTISPECIES: DksA/TraR family C4-type zinc finger protein [Desulfotignum]|jgi:phage/conjugal plasmid C-4 type zinc finger TraR family protein|uniref:Transcriptional regulator, TraR/DksA family n=2 Tax=Desulfotignum TaxID=115780 RepID=S0FQD8_9BACT|nr:MULTISPECIES: DksA/TraR family C4-type zinc finger protein [Desulfotignum]EMS77283.1 transcriptional regulator, TraR/DksA family [Desulfotignum phosphitoxidans DSM 13687]MBG0779355.1 DksA/TraR family C4-type zinc finger protein [Desulfotignum balticum]